MVISEI